MTNIVNPFFDLPNSNPQTAHVFSVPHNPSHLDAACCAFAQKSPELCWMLKSIGFNVKHYGNELSVDTENPERGVECDEHITVTTEAQLMDAYPDWRENLGHVDYHDKSNAESVKHLSDHFNLNTVYEVKKRAKPGDIFCYVVPTLQIAIWNGTHEIPGIRHVETGVGYYGSFLPYRIFESSQIQSWHYGYFTSNFDRYQKLDDEAKKAYPFNPTTHIATYEVPQHDAVIPNAFNVNLFDFKLNKGKKLLYLGRVTAQKGLRTAIEIAERMQMTLVVAGPGDFEKELKIKPSKYIEIVGPVGSDERRELLANAAALLCPTDYWEPFGGVNIQAMLAGTVPIGSNSGGFLENIRSGYNGYRIGMNRVEQGVWAVENVDKIDPYNLRDFGLRFSKEQIALRYNEYFQSLDRALRHNDEVYSIQNIDRADLDWVDYDRKIEWPEGWMTPIDVIDSQVISVPNGKTEAVGKGE